jgi:pilus assembly protein CpaB
MNLDRLKRLRQFRPGRTWIILAVALAVGGLAAFAASRYLNNRMEAIEARTKGKTTQVVVAKVDIARGVKLDNTNVAIRNVPNEYGHSVAVTPGDFPRIDGQPLAYPVKAGEMILWGLMEPQKAPTFSARVEAGRRAMTVPVDEINSISGLLEPGDMIDLIATVDQNGRKLTFPLLQRVHVLATGQRQVDEIAGDSTGDKRHYTTVTIDTTPAQAQNLIVARDIGKLTALLRNPDDNQPIGADVNDLASLLGMQGKPKAAASGQARRAVPVIYGNAKVPPEALYLRRTGGRAIVDPGAGAGSPANGPARPDAGNADQSAPDTVGTIIGMR